MQQKNFSQNPSFNPANHGSIFLLGLMGSGKSFWADKLGELLNIPSFHLDDEIEKSEQKKITEIFDEKGEDYFRQKETEILKSFSNKNNFILSVGGGTPCFNNNMDWMNDNGITIWIDEPIEIIEKRLLKEKSHRPLIANVGEKDLYSFLSNMHERRSLFYAKAQHHLKQNEISKEEFLKIILHE